MATKAQKLERARKAGVLVTAARNYKINDRDRLFNYIMAHLAYGSIDLDDFADYFFVEHGLPCPEGVHLNDK
jgi:hypothetical protein